MKRQQTQDGRSSRPATNSDARGAAYGVGYTFPPGARPFLAKWTRTNLFISAGCALCDLGLVVCVSIPNLYLLHRSLILGGLSYPVVAIVAARCFRGLENLVHEASHYNWCRTNKVVNDRLANVLAAFPVCSRVSSFRDDHTRHHREFASAEDPCFDRYVNQLHLEQLDRTSLVEYLRGLRGRLRGYVAGWWSGPSGISCESLIAGACWHLVVVLVPLAILYGGMNATIMWVAYFAVPFFLVLPPFRFVAEAAKHDYVDNSRTIFSSTFSNAGKYHWLWHPHSDGLHLLHHLRAAIPHHRLRQVDRWLMRNDAVYAGSRRRNRLLEHPTLTNEPTAIQQGDEAHADNQYRRIAV